MVPPTNVGSRTYGPDFVDAVAFPKGVTAESGWTISDLNAPLLADIVTYNPTIVAHSIGVNDVGTANAVAAAYMAQINAALALAWNGIIICGGPSVKPDTDPTNSVMAARAAAIKALVVAHPRYLTRLFLYERNTHWVSFSGWEATFFDGDAHPNDAGYNYDAQGWYSVLLALGITTGDKILWAGDSQMIVVSGPIDADNGGPRTRAFRLYLNASPSSSGGFFF